MILRLFLLPFFLLITIGCFSQKNKFKHAPPGTVQINDTLFVDKREIANIHWREYLAYLEQIEKNEASITKALPDTLAWMEDSMYNYYINYYFRHPSTNQYPVVGISYEQAVAFCKWRTFAANQADYLRKNKFKNSHAHLKDSFPIKYYYRLPTEQEWELVAGGGVDTSVSYYGGIEERFPNRCCYYNTNG